MVVAVLMMKLPRVGKMKGRNPEDEHSSRKCPSAAENDRGTTRKNTKCVTDDTKEIAALFVVGFLTLFLAPSHINFVFSAGNARTGSINVGFCLELGIDFPGELRKTWFPN